MWSSVMVHVMKRDLVRAKQLELELILSPRIGQTWTPVLAEKESKQVSWGSITTSPCWKVQ